MSERAVTFDRLLTISEVAAFLQRVAAPADELVGLVSHAVRSDAVVFGEPAFAAGTLAKGQLIRVTGRLDQREWTADDDTRRQTREIVAERVDLVGAPVRPAASGNSQ